MATMTILGVFDDRDTAKRALDDLRDSAITLHDTSLIAPGEADGEKLTAPEGALVGAAWGGLVGLVALAIPGIGPFIAGGAVAAALTGAAAGAVVGGLGGALMQSANLSQEDAQRYESAVQQGKTLVVVKADDANAMEVRRILAHDGATSVRENQTEIGTGKFADVSVYDHSGRSVSDVAGSTAMIDRTANTITTSELAGADRLAPGRDAVLGNTTSNEQPTNNTSGREDSFDTEDRTTQTGYENGARVTSFEDAEKPTPAAPRDVA